MNIKKFFMWNQDTINEAIINTKSFSKIKVKHPCKKTIFDLHPKDSFIIVLDDTGKVIVYEKGYKTTYKNLREFISLFGSDFFKNSIINTKNGQIIKNFYEKNTNLSIRNIYKYDLN